eukprot:Sdes_comp19986_c0_seq3m12589
MTATLTTAQSQEGSHDGLDFQMNSQILKYNPNVQGSVIETYIKRLEHQQILDKVSLLELLVSPSILPEQLANINLSLLIERLIYKTDVLCRETLVLNGIPSLTHFNFNCIQTVPFY